MSGLPEVIEGGLRRERKFRELTLSVSFGGTLIEVMDSGLVRIGLRPDQAPEITWWRDALAIAEHLRAHHAQIAELLGVDVEVPF